jgi:RNA recognition motif-containing protein
VRNINSNVDDEELRELFEECGPIRSMYTQCKHRGFVMISYFDIRHAKAAMRSLQARVLRRRKLDVHYSIPKENPSEKDQNQGTLVVFNLDPSTSNEELYRIFGEYGEIKEIRETPNKKHHKFIEFFDVRDAELAMAKLNKTEINAKRIKIEPSRPGGARKGPLMSSSSLIGGGGSVAPLPPAAMYQRVVGAAPPPPTSAAAAHHRQHYVYDAQPAYVGAPPFAAPAPPPPTYLGAGYVSHHHSHQAPPPHHRQHHVQQQQAQYHYAHLAVPQASPHSKHRASSRSPPPL